MSVLAWCGVAILLLVLSSVLRAVHAELVGVLSMSGSVLLFAAAITALLPFFRYAKELSQAYAISEQATLLLKMFGIGAIVELCCDLCREMGENAVANQLEFLGRAELLLLALPSLRTLLEQCLSLV